MAEPFISPLGLTITPALSYASKVEFREIWWSQKGTNLEIEEDTISPAPRFALTNYDSRHSYEKRDVSDEISKNYISPILLPLVSNISRNSKPAILMHLRTEFGGSLFFLNSGFPFFTEATTMSPTPASGSLLRRAPKPKGSIM